MRNTLRFCCFVVLLGIAFGGCIKDNTPAKPAYIYIESISFSADSTQGSSSSNITDVWPSVDGQQLGANAVQSLFPVILDENFQTNSVRISAGIKDNGISNSRAIYPFYEPAVTNIVLESGKIDTFRPTLQYDPTAAVVIVEDFENPNQPIFTEDLDKNPNTIMLHQDTEVFEGTYSGLMVLDSANLDCTVASSSRYFDLQPSFATPVYIELDYNTNTAFQVGIVAHYDQGQEEVIYKGGGNPTDGAWKKIYFNLTNEAFTANANEYSLIFKAVKFANTQHPKVYLDNIKLLYYP